MGCFCAYMCRGPRLFALLSRNYRLLRKGADQFVQIVVLFWDTFVSADAPNGVLEYDPRQNSGSLVLTFLSVCLGVIKEVVEGFGSYSVAKTSD